MSHTVGKVTCNILGCNKKMSPLNGRQELYSVLDPYLCIPATMKFFGLHVNKFNNVLIISLTTDSSGVGVQRGPRKSWKPVEVLTGRRGVVLDVAEVVVDAAVVPVAEEEPQIPVPVAEEEPLWREF